MLACQPTHVRFSSSSFSRHYLAVPPGPHLLSSAILNSAILAGDRGIPDELAAVPGAVGAGGSGGASQFEFGVDPTLDPELAMVRLSFSRSHPTRNSLIPSGGEKGPADVYGRGSCTAGSCQRTATTATRGGGASNSSSNSSRGCSGRCARAALSACACHYRRRRSTLTAGDRAL